MAGEIWILWTIRLSMLHYAIFLGCWMTERSNRLQRWIWTVACLFFVLHFLAAFHFYHRWSHTHAFDDTAEQTLDTLGVSFGSGIYFSYLFMAIWIVDVIWWWSKAENYERRDRRVSTCVQGFIFFIAFNGTVVFEDGAIRWAAILACLGLGGLMIRRLVRIRFEKSSG